MVVAVAVVGGGLGWMALAGPRDAPRPDDGGAGLIAACRRALDQCDTDAFCNLIYTGETPEGRDLSAHREIFESDCGRPLESVTIEPLETTDVTSYDIKGVHYRPTLPPTGKLVIRYASDSGAAVHGEVTTFLVGRSDGLWRILTAEPDR